MVEPGDVDKGQGCEGRCVNAEQRVVERGMMGGGAG